MMPSYQISLVRMPKPALITWKKLRESSDRMEGLRQEASFDQLEGGVYI